MTGVDGPVPAHEFPVRIYYEDTDAGGVVYYANYLRYAERARSEFLRDFGVESSTLIDRDGIAFAVRHIAADYRRPARLDDLLTVRSRLTGLKGASFDVEQVVHRNDEILVHMDVTLVCMTLAGRPARLPKGFRDLMKDAVTPAPEQG